MICKISLCALVDSIRAEYIYTLVLVWMQLPIFESVGAFYLVAPWPLFKCNICERRRDPLPDIDMPTTYLLHSILYNYVLLGDVGVNTKNRWPFYTFAHCVFWSHWGHFCGGENFLLLFFKKNLRYFPLYICTLNKLEIYAWRNDLAKWVQKTFVLSDVD